MFALLAVDAARTRRTGRGLAQAGLKHFRGEPTTLLAPFVQPLAIHDLEKAKGECAARRGQAQSEKPFDDGT